MFVIVGVAKVHAHCSSLRVPEAQNRNTMEKQQNLFASFELPAAVIPLSDLPVL